MAPSSETSGILPPFVRGDEPSGAPQGAPTLTTSSSPNQKPNRTPTPPTERPTLSESKDSLAPRANALSNAPTVEEQEPSSFPPSSDCESICERWVGMQCIITDSADRPVSEPCKIGKDWEALSELFLSNELSIDNQIRRRRLIVAAFATTQARFSAALSD